MEMEKIPFNDNLIELKFIRDATLRAHFGPEYSKVFGDAFMNA